MKLIDWDALQRVIGARIGTVGGKGRLGKAGRIDILPLASSRRPLPNLWERERKKDEGKFH